MCSAETLPCAEVGTGQSFSIACRRSQRKGSVVGGAPARSWNWPGRTRGVPYINSDCEAPKSSSWVALIPYMTHGRWSIQLCPVSRAASMAFNCWWNLSTIPLACGWYAVVWCREVPSNRAMSDHNWEMNWTPLSEMILAGMPNRDTHWPRNALATVAKAMFGIQMASGHREKQSTIINMYANPWKGGSGPTKSMLMDWNRASGTV